MPPRRKQPLEQHDTNAQPAASSRSSRSSSSTNKHKQALAAAASRRATRKRVSEASTAATEEDEYEAEDSEGENVGPEGDATEEDEEDEDSEPVKPKRGVAARGARTVKHEPATGRTRRGPASAAATSRRRNVREDTVSTAASDDDVEDDEQKEEGEPVRARAARSSRTSRSTTTSARSTRGKKASTPEQPAAPLSPPATPAVDEDDEEDEAEQQDDDDEEEEEEIKPRVSTSKRKKRVSLAPASLVKQPVLPTPEPESSAAEEEDGEDEQTAQEDEDVEDREETPQPPAAAKFKAKGKRRAVVQSDEDEEDELAQPAAPAAAAAQVAPPSPAPSATPRSRSTTPTPAEPAAAPAPAPEPVAPAKPAPPTALTASALASIARQAAIDHAAQAAKRAKELMGKPRLVIHQLVLENFKSYKGRNTIGPFHKAFSAIVGPNGSGKSNTIDALLFVFGFRATKMRQGKFSELIHNSGVAGVAEPAPVAEAEADEDNEDGFFNPEEYDSEEEVEMRKRKGKGKAKGKKTARKAPSYAAAGGCDFATVEVWFREIVDSPTSRDDFSVVPHSQLVVARTVRRDNSTRYIVNGKNATPGEVKQLLLGKGIDLTHNRFLILQGEVESIAQMKPKGANDHEEGLLEYLEDIIGTAKYKPLIEEASVDVERLGDERAVQMNRVKLVEKEKGALESRKKAADAYLHDQLTLVSLQNQLYQRHAHQAGADRVVYEQQVAEAKVELDAEMERQKSDRERYDQGVEQYEMTKKNLKEIEDAANGLAKELATFEKAKVQLNVQKKAADTKYAKLKKSLEEDKHAAQQAQSDIRDHTDTLEKLVISKDKLKTELEEEQAALTKVMDSLRDKIEGFSVEIEQHQKSLAPWTEQIEAKQNEVKIATQQLEDVRGKSAQVAADIERTEQEIEELEEAAKKKAVELRTLQKGRKDILAQIGEARQRVQEEKTVEAKHRAVVNSAREKTAEAKASQKASESKGHVLSAVLKLKEQGRLPGFHGRLGDLGRIDDKYDIAVSTAAASGLESLVVDTRETAEVVFDHLRKHNIGRAACIALDRFGKVDLSPIKTPQGTQRLFDLVTPKDAIYAPAFRHVLKDTLVAPSWDVAHPVSTGKVDGQRWRVVTLDGNVAEKSGAAQVGGSRPIRGKMSSRLAADDVSPQQLAKLESEEKTATVKLEQAAEQSKQAEADLKVLEKQLAQAESSIPKVEMDLEANKQDAAQKAELLAELRGQSKPDAGDVKRVAQLERAIETLEEELESLRSKASKFEDKIAALQAKIEEVGGLKLRSQKAKVSDLQDQIRHNESRLVKAKTERAKAEKDHAKATKAIESNTAKMQELEIELKDLRRQLAEKEEEAEPIRQTVEAAQAKVEEGREELGNLKSDLDEQEEAIIEFKKAEAKLRTIYTEQEKLLKETTRIFEHWTAKISSLEMPEFELLGDVDEEDEDGNRPPKVEEVLRQLEPDEIEQIDVKRLKGEIALLEERLEKNNADLAVLQEYKRREEEFRRRGEEFEAVSREWDGAKTRVTELRNERLVQFMQGFGIISNKLKEMYQMITLGGNAELELYDSADPFSEGILFSVMPPKKSWKNISNLSGGEKTLSSLALVFALHTYKPTPLYFLDEIDAALDFRNVSIVANYIKTHSVFSQFLIISLRNNMFELAARLVGIYKVSNQTRSIAIDNKELSAVPDVPSTALEEDEADIQEEEEEEEKEAGSEDEDDA
ncbi:Structural maintenance of chromosomes protein 4 [Rhodotorula toruloides]